MTGSLGRLSARLYNTPLLVMPDTALALADTLGERIAGLKPMGALEDELLQPLSVKERPYAVVDGVATIPVRGELVNRGSFLNSLSGLTSYDSLKGALAAAAADQAVKAVVLDIDAPGGEAAGAMETAAAVRELSSAKPVVAYVNALAASAAYAIAAGAATIVASPSATLGSIGVVWMHLDRSQALAKAGVKPTLLHAGAFKVDGNTMNALEPEARARIQSQIDDVYDLFVESVGKHRPALGSEGARSTEAGLFLGRKAIDAGLADMIGNFDDALSALKSEGFSGVRAPKASFARVTHTAVLAVAETTDADAVHIRQLAECETAALKRGADAERARIAAIIDHAEAQGRESLAKHLALSTDFAAEESAAILATSAKAAAPKLSLADRAPRVTLSPDGPAREPANEFEAGAQAAMKLLAAVGVRPRTAAHRGLP